MRRALTSLFLAVFSFPLIAPALLANSASDVPSCCRRNGEHHCYMVDMADRGELPTGPTVEATRPKCLLFPKAGLLAASPKTTLLCVSPRVGPPLLFRLAIQKKNENRPRIAFRSSAQKRGPPSILDQTSNSLL
jgi:hypothetical protein